jgi:hypothetical protein
MSGEVCFPGVWVPFSSTADLARSQKRQQGCRGPNYALQRLLAETRIWIRTLAEVGDFFVEVGEGGFEGFAVLGVGGGG